MPLPPMNFRNPATKKLLSRLRKVRLRGNREFTACCPAHPDDNPSLSGAENPDGRIVLKCFSHHCEFSDIADAVDMHPAEFAPISAAPSPASLGQPTSFARHMSGSKRLPERLDTSNRRNGHPANKLDGADGQALKHFAPDELLLSVAKRTSERLAEDRSVALPFPLDVLPDDLKRLVAEVAESLPCPPDDFACGLLVVVSTFIGSGRPLQPKRGWTEWAILYLIIVAPPGSRKTPATERAMLPARRRERELAAMYKILKAEHLQNQRAAKGKKVEFNDPLPVPRQHVIGDTTIEALADALERNPKGVLLHLDEATALVARFGQYKQGKGADKEAILSAWSCQDITINRNGKDEPQRVTHPFLSILANTTPDMLSVLGDSKGREDGFRDRLLLSYPDPVSVEWTDSSPDPDLEAAYVEACNRIGTLPDTVLTLDDQAREEFAAWYA